MHKRKNKIRIFSLLFVIAAVSIAGVILAPFFHVKEVLTPSDSLKEMETDSFDGIHIALYDSRDRRMDVSAGRVSEKGANYVLKRMTSRFMVSEEKCEVSSDIAKSLANEQLDLSGNVQLKTNSGLSLNTEHSLINTERKTAKGNCKVIITKDNSKISGDKYFINLEKKYLNIEGNAKAEHFGKNLVANQLGVYFNTSKIEEVIAVGSVTYSSKIYFMTANKMHYKKQKLTTNGSVDVFNIQKNERICSDQMLAYFDDNDRPVNVQFIGNAKYFSRECTLKSSKLLYRGNQINAIGNVVLDYKINQRTYRIASSSMIAKIGKSRISSEVLADNRLIIKSNNDTIRADSGRMQANKLFLSGNVLASSDMGDIFGDKAELNLTTGEIVIKNSGGVIKEGVTDAK